MRNTLDIVDLVYTTVVANTELTTSLTGRVYKNIRPVAQPGNEKEDVVIGSLPITAQQLQTAVLNLNIHVPNLNLSFAGVQDNTQPNIPRIKYLTSLVMTIVDQKYINDYWFFVQQQNLFADEQAYNHYSNIRIEFYSENN